MDYLFLIVSMLSSVTRSLLSKRLSPHVSSSAGFGAVNTMLFGAAFITSLVFSAAQGNISVSGLTLVLGLLYAAFTVLAQLSYMRALSEGRVSSVSFLYSCGFLIPTAAGILIWHEGITFVGALGKAMLVPAFRLCGATDNASRKEKAEIMRGKVAISGSGRGSRSGRVWIYWAVTAMVSSGFVGLIQKIHRTSPASNEVSGFIVISM